MSDDSDEDSLLGFNPFAPSQSQENIAPDKEDDVSNSSAITSPNSSPMKQTKNVCIPDAIETARRWVDDTLENSNYLNSELFMVSSPEELCWYVEGKTKSKGISLYPCRMVLDEKETAGLLFSNLSSARNNRDAYASVQFIEFPVMFREYQLVSKKKLCRFDESMVPSSQSQDSSKDGLENDTNDDTTRLKWNSEMIGAYKKKLKTMARITKTDKTLSTNLRKYGIDYNRNRRLHAELYLMQRILDAADQKHKQKIQADLDNKQAIEDVAEASDDENSSSEMMDEPYAQAFNEDEEARIYGYVNDSSSAHGNKEPLRPGDIINYYSPIFTAGDKHGLRTAQVLIVRTKATMKESNLPMLTLSNGEVIPPETQVKRVNILDYKKAQVISHSYGIYRRIECFKLKDMVFDMKTFSHCVLEKESDRTRKILEDNVKIFQKKLKEDGLQCFGGLVNKVGKESKKSTYNVSSKTSRKEKNLSQENDSCQHSLGKWIIRKKRSLNVTNDVGVVEADDDGSSENLFQNQKKTAVPKVKYTVSNKPVSESLSDTPGTNVSKNNFNSGTPSTKNSEFDIFQSKQHVSDDFLTVGENSDENNHSYGFSSNLADQNEIITAKSGEVPKYGANSSSKHVEREMLAMFSTKSSVTTKHVLNKASMTSSKKRKGFEKAKLSINFTKIKPSKKSAD